MNSEENDHLLTEGLVRYIHVNAQRYLITSIAVACIATLLLWEMAPHSFLIPWLIALVLATATRILIVRAYLRAERPDPTLWRRRYVAGTVITGAIWGLLGWFGWGDSPMPIAEGTALFIPFIMGGVIAGSVAAHSALLALYLGFTTPAFAPLLLHYVVIGGTAHNTMAALLAFFFITMLLTALALNKSTLSSLTLGGALHRKVEEHSRVANELRQERDLFINGPVTVFKWRATDGWPVEYVSPNVTRFGYQPKDLTGGSIPFVEMVHADDQAAVADEIIRCVAEKKDTFRQSYRMVAPDGSFRWIDDYTLVERDAAGKVTFFHGYVVDISDYREAEEKLKTERQRLDRLLKAGHSVVFALAGTPPYTITHLSGEGLESVFGYNPAEVVAQKMTVANLLHPDDLPEAVIHIEKALDVGSAILEYRLRTNSGDYRWVRSILNAEKTDGENGAELAGVSFDIHGRRMAEEEAERAKIVAEEATRLKDMFVSLVAHDLKSPLGAISGLLQILNESENLNDDERKMMDRVVDATDVMSRMVNELLDIGRLQTGKINPDYLFWDASYLVETLLSLHTYRADQKGITLINKVPPGVRLYTDRELFTQALGNILENAIKFSSSGDSVSLFVPGGKETTIAVRDEGAGIESSLLPDLFAHEIKTSRTGTDGEKGTGLGLPLCHDIITALGGSLTVESTPGGGSLFCVTLPTIVPRILVVDDHKDQRYLIKLLLDKVGATIQEASNGEEALELLRSEEIHLVITDLNMPVMDGFQLIETIKGNPATRNLPVVVTSSFNDVTTRERVVRLGVDDFLSTPVKREELIPRIRRFIA